MQSEKVYKVDMAKPSKLNVLKRTVTLDVVAHPRDLTRHYAERLGVSRPAANKYVSLLEKEGWIARSGTSTHPVFSLGYNRRVCHVYELHGLEEDAVWHKDFRPYFNLSPNVHNIAVHGFTEMLNNAIDHSIGEGVFVWVDQSETDLYIAISDDGIGIFRKISTALNLPDMRLALLELAKGKLTTDPERHSGEGVFFTSRMFDNFKITANGLEFSHHDFRVHDWLQEARGAFAEGTGTTVLMGIALDSARNAADIYAEFTNSPEDYDFSKTVVPMRLAKIGDEQLVSRSQAKRLIARFDRFKTVILDFDGVQHIGQAFADELFRVYAESHADVKLLPQNMTDQVQKMWSRATPKPDGA